MFKSMCIYREACLKVCVYIEKHVLTTAFCSGFVFPPIPANKSMKENLLKEKQI